MSSDHLAEEKAPAQATALPNSVEHWTAREPDRAVLFEADNEMTWAQIDERADRLAEGLARHGVGAGDVVAVRTLVRMEWVVIDAALAKLRCRLLGMNWRLTPTEARFMLTDSDARAVVCDDQDPAAFAEALTGTGVVVAVSMDVPAAGFVDYAELAATERRRRLSAGSAPLVIYTAGTTGRPKGVVMGPRPGREQDAAEFQADIASYAAGMRDDVYLATLPFSHGAGPNQVRRVLSHGGRIVFQRRFDPVGALDLINRYGVTTWSTVPTMLQRVAALPPDVLERKRPTHLRMVVTGAAPSTPELKSWLEDYFGEILYESYGTTEVGLVSIAPPGLRRTKPGSCGLPYRHVEVDIRDADGTVLPAGTTGEIWVRTPVVLSRYVNAPPLGPDVLDEAGYFRTGDVGRLDEGGYLFITDRVKDMIVSGGVNIYPAEIEAALQRLEPVFAAAAIGIPDEEFGEQVKAFVELKPGATAAADELIAGLRGVLASYKQPRSIEIVDQLPRNHMGKLLKKDLRAPYWEGKERKI
ncbi:AMP-binding protein [Streptomyces sp. NPDC008092]|uniref:class I adenylate-forming enzyme family protein n=1 Tax=Streptomyces sp. NPDC008092 TaxID=3364808 RepID=UPI0036F05EA8